MLLYVQCARTYALVALVIVMTGLVWSGEGGMFSMSAFTWSQQLT